MTRESRDKKITSDKKNESEHSLRTMWAIRWTFSVPLLEWSTNNPIRISLGAAVGRQEPSTDLRDSLQPALSRRFQRTLNSGIKHSVPARSVRPISAGSWPGRSPRSESAHRLRIWGSGYT